MLDDGAEFASVRALAAQLRETLDQIDAGVEASTAERAYIVGALEALESLLAQVDGA